MVVVIVVVVVFVLAIGLHRRLSFVAVLGFRSAFAVLLLDRNGCSMVVVTGKSS